MLIQPNNTRHLAAPGALKSAAAVSASPTFDYSKCLMHCHVFKKGLLSRTKYNLYLENDRMILSKEAYAKVPLTVIQFSQTDQIKWQVIRLKEDIKYIGFTLTLNRDSEEKKTFEFQADEIVLFELQSFLLLRLFNNRIQDEYNFQAQIGKGSYARVFSARHRKDGSKIAVKCFEKEKLKKSKLGFKPLYKELAIMKRFGKHPNLIQLIGCYEGEHTFYIAMNMLEGQSLHSQIKHRARNGGWSALEIKHYMRELLIGVSHFHKHGVMHRDLKPDNILMEEPTVKQQQILSIKSADKSQSLKKLVIVDFGLAEFEDTDSVLYEKCGTPGFVAPELLNFESCNKKLPYTTKCDLFSVGVIFHQLLYGASVFKGKKFQEVLIKNKECEIDFTSKLYESTSPVTLDLLKGLLNSDFNARLSAEEALSHRFFDDDHTQDLLKMGNVPKNKLLNLSNSSCNNEKTAVVIEKDQMTKSCDPPTKKQQSRQYSQKQVSDGMSSFLLNTHTIETSASMPVLPSDNQIALNATCQGINSIRHISIDYQNNMSFITNLNPMFHNNDLTNNAQPSACFPSEISQTLHDTSHIPNESKTKNAPLPISDSLFQGDTKRAHYHANNLKLVQEEEEGSESPQVHSKRPPQDPAIQIPTESKFKNKKQQTILEFDVENPEKELFPLQTNDLFLATEKIMSNLSL